ncbi:hypothetical protein JOC78_000746 [Bacillus ectoiniformans]|uniref:DUF5105 domain-containing protein n=1 Tax=Bacillus ectoiniformans TaxID=1494429 RepID=UPI0019563ED8|nr:DUF5105 domain-containing protein [Bacillus ectoiniformans]MBM7647806.1 hypothetical protein [Bacillus ectoiniformans]
MLKKMSLAGTLMALSIGLAGCGGDEETSASGTAKSKVMEATIQDASYILANQNNGVSEGEEPGLLAVNFKIKNTSDSSITLSGRNDVKLYDGENQLSPNTEAAYSVDIPPAASGGEIGAGKVKEMTVFFDVEKGKEYEVALKPFVNGEPESEEVTMKLNTQKYEDSLKTLNDPAKALAGYVDTIYLGKENTDYEKLVTADKAALQEEARNKFKENLTRGMDKQLTDEEVNKYYETFKNTLAQKAKIEPVVLSNANGKAEVSLQYSAVSMSKFYDQMYNYQKEYYQNAGYDREKAEEYALSKFDAIVNSLEVKQGASDIKIKMLEKDGRWTVDPSHHSSKYLVDAFGAGSIY